MLYNTFSQLRPQNKLVCHCYLCRDGCWIMWECMCISLCGTPCLCTLSASAFIELSLYQLDFFLETFLWQLVSLIFDMRSEIINFSSTFLAQACIKWNVLKFLVSALFKKLFSIKFVMWCHPCNHSWCVIHARVLTNGVQQLVHSAPQSSSQKSAGGKSWLRSKQSSNGPSQGNFLTVGGYFERYTYRITVLGWLKKEERKKEEDEQFWRSTVSGLPL